MRVWKRVDFHMASEIFLCKNEMSLCKKGRAPGGRSKCRTPTATRARKRSRRSASRSPVQSGPRASLRLSPSLFLAPCPLLPARQPPSCRRPSRTVLLLAPVSAAQLRSAAQQARRQTPPPLSWRSSVRPAGSSSVSEQQPGFSSHFFFSSRPIDRRAFAIGACARCHCGSARRVSAHAASLLLA